MRHLGALLFERGLDTHTCWVLFVMLSNLHVCILLAGQGIKAQAHKVAS